jgi:hypothetical protein
MENQLPNRESNFLISGLSSHLFWDIDKNVIDPIKNKKWIIGRVLSYGLISDWKLIYNYYGLSEIAQTAVQIKDLDKKSVSFISALTNIPLENFICYTITQSNQKHWNF